MKLNLVSTDKVCKNTNKSPCIITKSVRRYLIDFVTTFFQSKDCDIIKIIFIPIDKKFTIFWIIHLDCRKQSKKDKT